MSEKQEIQKQQESKDKHFVIQIIGVLLLIVGIIMLITPGPGWILIIIAVLLLGEESKIGRWIITKLPQKIREEIRKRRKK